MPGGGSPPGLEDAWRKRQIILGARSGGAPPGTLSLTGKFFQIGFDFADLIGDHAFQMA